jgi:hypothetical protein
MSAFDADNLQELVMEVLKDYHNVPLVGEGWDELEVVIYEWNESAIAILSNELAASFSEAKGKDLFAKRQKIKRNLGI